MCTCVGCPREHCGLGLSGLGVGHGGAVQSQKTGPLATGPGPWPVCQKSKAGTQYQGKAQQATC